MKNRILSVDPGPTESAYCIIDSKTYKPLEFGKVKNEELMIKIYANKITDVDALAIEMIASYGMAVGKEVFETCVWIGRFIEAIYAEIPYKYVYRKEVKLNLCNSSKAKDSNVRQALIDRFAKFDFKNGKGIKKNQDFFYGFKADIWAAYAVGCTYLDNINTSNN